MPETLRKKIIQRYELLDSYDLGLAPLMDALATLYEVPVALVTIADEGRSVVRASYGTTLTSMPQSTSLCRHIIDCGQPLVIEDLSLEAESAALFEGMGNETFRFYTGVPLQIEEVVVGTVCLFDRSPRCITAKQIESLEQISHLVSNHLCLVKEHVQLKLEHSLLDSSPAVLLTWHYKNCLLLQSVSRNIKDVTAIEYAQLIEHDACFEDFLTVESQQEFGFWLQNHLDGVENAECHLNIKHPTRTVWLRMLSKAFFDQNGKLHSIQAIITDNTAHKYMEDRLSGTNKQMRLLIEASGLGTWDWNIIADATKVNKRWCDILGVDHDFYDGTSQFWRQRIHPADLSKVDDALDSHLCGRSEAYMSTYRLKHGDGHWVWVETYGCVVERNELGQPLRLAGTHRDITERKEAELFQQKQGQLLSFINNARAAYLVDNNLPRACQAILPELIDIADSQFGFIGHLIEEQGKRRLLIHAISELSWNSTSEQLLDLYKGGELYFYSFDNLFGEVIKSGEEVISNRMHVHTSSRGTPGGHPPIFSFLGLPIYIQDRLVGMIGLANKAEEYSQKDVVFLQPLLDALGGLYYAVELEHARSEAEERLKYLAMTDALSGLPNRRAFIDHCRSLEKEGAPYAIAIIDIDHFKVVNDTYGHEAGDAVICHIAQCMKSNLRTDDFVARMGGEEFAVIINHTERDHAEKVLENIRCYIDSNPAKWEEKPIHVTVSIGANWYRKASMQNLKRHLHDADKALYMAKNSQRNCLQWYVQTLVDASTTHDEPQKKAQNRH
ncbi:diguanylate cyclase [Vibrio sp. AK197]